MTQTEEKKLARFVGRVSYLIEAVKGMREAQQRYFKLKAASLADKTQVAAALEWLETAKKREKAVDLLLTEEMVWK